MRGSRNSRHGGIQVSLTKKALTFLFFSPQLILQKSNGQFQRNLSFSRFQRGSNIFQGGPTFSRGRGGSNCLLPIETHITCDFPGGVWTPCPPPSGSALGSPRSDCFCQSILIRVFPVCYSDNHYVNPSPENHHFLRT